VKQLTIRGLPPEIEKIVEEEARRKGLSYNKAIISLLRKAIGREQAEKKTACHDLDHLCGRWNEAEGMEFEKRLLEQRRIDANLWK